MGLLVRFFYCLYQLLIALPLLLLSTVLTALTTTVGCTLGSAHFWGYHPGRLWSKFFCAVLLLPVRVEGREHLEDGTSYVFVSNHQGAFDIFLIYGYLGRNFKWMMKQSLRKIPLVGQACERARHIYVDKSTPKRLQRTYAQARQILTEGTSLVVFPEGSRTHTGSVGVFHKGAYQLACELGLQMVPVTIDGPFFVLPRDSRWPFVHRHVLTLRFHAPVKAPSDNGDIARVIKETRDTIVGGLSGCC